MVQASRGIPVIRVNLTKQAILSLSKRLDVGTIYLAESQKYQPSNYRPNNLIGVHSTSVSLPQQTVNNRDGTGQWVALLDHYGNVDFTSNSSACPGGTNNCFRHPGETRPSNLPVANHVTWAASMIASTRTITNGLPPLASGATIYSAGVTGQNPQDTIDALTWAFNKGVDIASISENPCFRDDLTVADQALDYYARSRDKLIVVSAGNYYPNKPCPDLVGTPGRGWNVLTVGAYDNVANWMPSPVQFSAWRNPSSPNNDP